MCDFISWIEKNDKQGKKHIFFLTGNDIFNTKRGRELQAFCGTSRDYVGHGSIEFFYPEAVGGTHKECTDFSTPENFPKEVVAAIKAGAFRGMEIPKGVLLAKQQAKYSKACDAAYAEYDKVRNATLAECDKVRNAALAEYNKVCDAAWAEYDKVRNAFWDLFAKPSNRKKAWR